MSERVFAVPAYCMCVQYARSVRVLGVRVRCGCTARVRINYCVRTVSAFVPLARAGLRPAQAPITSAPLCERAR
jgi:hypothetical protein